MDKITPPRPTPTEPPSTVALLKTLSLSSHPEGGYFRRTHQNARTVPNPFPSTGSTRPASTSIHYFLTPASPIGHFHRNRATTYHMHHEGRGTYVLIHPAGSGQGDQDLYAPNGTTRGRIEIFKVGPDIEKGERVQWIVGGGVWKASFLEQEQQEKGPGLLITEVVVPGFEGADHEFLEGKELERLVGEEVAKKWEGFLVKKN